MVLVYLDTWMWKPSVGSELRMEVVNQFIQLLCDLIISCTNRLHLY